jgi:hypothetical protein
MKNNQGGTDSLAGQSPPVSFGRWATKFAAIVAVILFVAGLLGSADLQAATYVRVNIGGRPYYGYPTGTAATTIIVVASIGIASIGTGAGITIRPKPLAALAGGKPIGTAARAFVGERENRSWRDSMKVAQQFIAEFAFLEKRRPNQGRLRNGCGALFGSRQFYSPCGTDTSTGVIPHTKVRGYFR